MEHARIIYPEAVTELTNGLDQFKRCEEEFEMAPVATYGKFGRL
jgi:hypothetical protein